MCVNLLSWLPTLRETAARHVSLQQTIGRKYCSKQLLQKKQTSAVILPFQVQVLRNAGEEVTLTVSFLKKTPAFLKLPLCEDCTCKNPPHAPCNYGRGLLITNSALQNNEPRAFTADIIASLGSVVLLKMDRNEEPL